MKIKLKKDSKKVSKRALSKKSHKSHSHKSHSRKSHSRKSHSHKSHSHKSHSHRNLGTLKPIHIEQLLLDKGVHPHIVHHLKASGFFDSFMSGLKSVGSQVIKNLPQIISTAKDMYSGYKQDGLKGAVNGAIKSFSGGKIAGGKKPSKRVLSTRGKAHAEKMKKRGKEIARIMKSEGVSLGEASKILKNRGSKKSKK